jgi:DNA-binding CsgD family transcriptional regulator
MARGGNSPFLLLLSSAERAQLAHWQRSTTIQAGLAKRGHIILWRADGLALAEIARRLGGGRRIVRTWLKRFLNQRLAGLSDKPGRGRQPVFSPRGGGTSGQDGLRATG